MPNSEADAATQVTSNTTSNSTRMAASSQKIATGTSGEDESVRIDDSDERENPSLKHRESSEINDNQNLLKESISKVKNTTKDVVSSTKEKTQKVLFDSKQIIESNPWLKPLKFLMNFPRHWPRINAIVFGVIVPLWILIFVSMGFGILLAQFESPEEIEMNDAILAARARIDFFDLSRSRLLNVTSICLAQWEREVLGDSVNAVVLDPNVTLGIFADVNGIEADTIQDVNQEFLDQFDAEGDGMVNINRTLLEQSLSSCVQRYNQELELSREVTTNNTMALDSLTFSWSRCWSLTQERQLIFFPTERMKQEARPSAQEAFYEEEWNRVQRELYELYLPDNATAEEDYDAFLRSVDEATGVDICEENMGATAWFFFTIMTTVGYGNQAPVTNNGRLLIVTAGLFSLILFGAVLALCGYVFLAIFDDAVSRLGCVTSKFFGNPFVGMLLWGSIWLLYASAMATDFKLWWEARLPEFASELTNIDSLWFAFISTSTIGLGDFFLQPEIVFAGDALKYSVFYMIGFVFLSTFLGKIGEFLSRLLPTKHNSLEARLKTTRFLFCWPQGFMPWESEPSIEERIAAEDVPDDQALLYRISQLKELKPDPPKEEGEEEKYRGVLSSLTGNPIHSMNVELLSQEAALLSEWLAIVEHQKARAMKRSQESSAEGEDDNDPETLENVPEHEDDNDKLQSSPPVVTANNSSEEEEAATTKEQKGEEKVEDESIISSKETFNPLTRFFN